MSLANRKRDLDVMNGQQGEAASEDGRQGRSLPQLEQRSINIESRQLPKFLATPPQVPSPRRGSPNNFATNDFTPDASIVLLGARGTGKSTLAVIAATILQRETLDADNYYVKQTGHSRSEFKRRRGVAEYSTSEEWVMRKMLSEHSRNSVIICNPGCVERSGQLLLKEYARSHPVIHVVRDLKSVQEYLKAWDEAKITRLLEVSEPIYRSCSNFEFYNLCEDAASADTAPESENKEHHIGPQPSKSPFLRLKHAEQDFLRFLSIIRNQGRRHLSCTELSMLCRSPFTYAYSLPLSHIGPQTFSNEDFNCGVNAFEVRIDVLGGPDSHDVFQSPNLDLINQKLALVRRYVSNPIVYHVEARKFFDINGDDNEYRELLRHGLRLGLEYLTVDLEWNKEKIKSLIAAKGATKIIGHFHDQSPSPNAWNSDSRLEIYRNAVSLGCDIVRITQVAISQSDNRAVQGFINSREGSSGLHIPLIAYNTGPLGKTSCCFNQLLTPITTADDLSRRDASSLNDGPSITLRDAQEALYSSFVLNRMQFWQVGAEVSYSMSPAMHKAGYAKCGMPHDFFTRNITSLDEILDLTRNENLGGVSIAQGFKLSSMSLVTHASNHVKAIGALNTIIPIRSHFDKDTPLPLKFWRSRNQAGPIQGFYGDNTDWVGILRCIRQNLSPANAIKQKTAGLVIGAGGMARAAIYALMQLGAPNIFIYNRTSTTAKTLADRFNSIEIEFSDIGNDTLLHNVHPPKREGIKLSTVRVIESFDDPWMQNFEQPTIIVCCVQALAINNNPAPNITVPPQWLKSPTGGVVVDLAYKPLLTPLIRQIRREVHRGWIPVDGLEYMPAQASLQFELFTGRKVPQSLLSATILRNYQVDDGDDETREFVRAKLLALEGRGPLVNE